MNQKTLVMAMWCVTIACGGAAKAAGNGALTFVQSKQARKPVDPAQRKAMVEQNLQNRIAQIEKRFAEDQSFRVRMKDKRISFEKKLAQDYKAFLENLGHLKLDQRKEAWQSFIQSQRQKRNDFKTLLRADAKKYFQSHAPAKPSAQK